MILDLKCEVPSSNVRSFQIKWVRLGLHIFIAKMAFVNNNTTFTSYLLLIFVVLLCFLFNIQIIILFLTGKPTEMAPW